MKKLFDTLGAKYGRQKVAWFIICLDHVIMWGIAYALKLPYIWYLVPTIALIITLVERKFKEVNE